MDFFTWSETLGSDFLSIFFGIAFGAACSLFSVIFMGAEGIREIFLTVPFYCVRITRLPELFKKGITIEIGKGSALRFIPDFVKTVTFAISFSMVLYVAVDGIFRLYMLALSLLSAYLFEKLVGKHAVRLEKRLVEALVLVTACIVSVALFPFAAPLRLVYKKFIQTRVKIFQEKVAKYSKNKHKKTTK